MMREKTSIVNKFENLVKKNPNAPLVIDDNKLWNRNDVLMFSLSIYEKIKDDISYGMNVGILTTNDISYIGAFLTLLKLETIITPINYHWTKDMITNCIEKTDISFILVDKHNLTKIKDNNIPFFIIDVDEYKTNEQMNFIFHTTTQNRSLDVPSIMLTTSGSTSMPKAAVLTERQMIERIYDEQNVFLLSDKDIMLISTPLYHSLATRMILSTLYTGNIAVIMKGFTPIKWLDYVEKYAITYAISVPAQLAQIVTYIKKKERTQYNIHTLRELISTSAYLEPIIQREMLLILPRECEFHNLFASSEVEFIAIANLRENNVKEDVLGKPVRETDILIEYEGTISQSKNIGEIVCKGRSVFEGYYIDGLVSTDMKMDGYFRTGDMGFYDGDKMLHYAGRKKEIIISGGVNIFPHDIENEIKKINGVTECVAYPIPDQVLGEVVGVVIVTNENIDLKMIRKHCLKKLSDYQQPRKIDIVDNIPKNELGKINRKLLYTYLGNENND